jgi:hypothetical protein
MVESHLLDRHRVAHGKRPNARGVSGLVGGARKGLVPLIDNGGL